MYIYIYIVHIKSIPTFTWTHEIHSTLNDSVILTQVDTSKKNTHRDGFIATINHLPALDPGNLGNIWKCIGKSGKIIEKWWFNGV